MQLKSFIYVSLKSNNVVKKFHPVVTKLKQTEKLFTSREE